MEAFSHIVSSSSSSLPTVLFRMCQNQRYGRHTLVRARAYVRRCGSKRKTIAFTFRMNVWYWWAFAVCVHDAGCMCMQCQNKGALQCTHLLDVEGLKLKCFNTFASWHSVCRKKVATDKHDEQWALMPNQSHTPTHVYVRSLVFDRNRCGQNVCLRISVSDKWWRGRSICRRWISVNAWRYAIIIAKKCSEFSEWNWVHSHIYDVHLCLHNIVLNVIGNRDSLAMILLQKKKWLKSLSIRDWRRC